MEANLVYWVIFLHFLSDWILQPRKVAKRKSSSIKWMLKHIVVIHVTFAILAYFAHVPQYLVLLNSVLHFGIDRIIWNAYKKIRVGDDYPQEYLDKNKWAEDYWYFFTIAVDQMLHLCILAYIFL